MMDRAEIGKNTRITILSRIQEQAEVFKIGLISEFTKLFFSHAMKPE